MASLDAATSEERVPSRGPDPLEAVADAETTRDFGRAFSEAWGRLRERERLLLLMRHRDGARQTDIASALGIGAPRVSRLLDRAVLKLRRALRDRMRGDGRRLWDVLRDTVAIHLARTEEPGAPPESLDTEASREP
jgi:DNA-directed RNA polymerase specialized sigma24 family protein